MLGKLHPDFFPAVFGPNADEKLDAGVVAERFADLAREIGKATGARRDPVEVASGFLRIAIDNMANASKQTSVPRDHAVTRYTLASFGRAGGQPACAGADAPGRTT